MQECEGDYCTVRNWCSQNTEYKEEINHFFIADLLFRISDGSGSSSRRYLFRYSRQITDTPSSISVLYCHVSTEHNGAQKNDHHERLLSVQERPLWAPANCEELSPLRELTKREILRLQLNWIIQTHVLNDSCFTRCLSARIQERYY